MSVTKAKASARVYHVLIIDDHPIVRRGLRNTIEDDPGLSVVGEAGTGTEGLRLLESEDPDLAIVDLSLGDCVGLDLIRRIAEEHPAVRILVISMHQEEIYAERVLRAGAHGFINKAEPADRLIEAMKRVVQGETALSPKMTDRLVDRAVQGSATQQTGIAALSDRELEVFLLIGQGLSTNQIAQRLSRSVKTVETHRERIKAKLGVQGAAELNHYAIAWVETTPSGSALNGENRGT